MFCYSNIRTSASRFHRNNETKNNEGIFGTQSHNLIISLGASQRQNTNEQHP